MLRRGIVLGGYAWRLPIDRDTSNLYLRQGWSSSFDLFVPEMSVAQFALRLVAISRGCDPTRMILCGVCRCQAQCQSPSCLAWDTVMLAIAVVVRFCIMSLHSCTSFF